MNRSRTFAMLLVVAALGGCGVGTDAAPRRIAQENVPHDLLGVSTTTVTSEPTNTVKERIYLVKSDQRLVPVLRDVQASPTVTVLLQSLLDPVSEEETEEGYRTSIPPGTHLTRAASPVGADGLVRLDLSEHLYDVDGDGLKRALAQITWTATEIDGVEQVEFWIGGNLREVVDEKGAAKRRVGRSDYCTFGPSPLSPTRC